MQAANERTMVGFLTFDTSLHFYNLKAALAQPQMLVRNMHGPSQHIHGPARFCIAALGTSLALQTICCLAASLPSALAWGPFSCRHCPCKCPGVPDRGGCVLQSVPEIVEPFVPLPDDLMVNLKESRAVIDTLLDSLPTAFGRTGTVSASGAGPSVACEEQDFPMLFLGCYLACSG